MGSICTSQGTQQSSATSSLNPEMQARYMGLLDRAESVASQPYTPYGGQLTANWNPNQQRAVAGLNTAPDYATEFYRQGTPMVQAGFQATQGALPFFAQGASTINGAQPYYEKAASTIDGAQPYFAQARDLATQSAGFADPTQYMSPYHDSVIRSTMNQMQHGDAVSQNGALGTMLRSGGAFGGDRMGVAAAELARGQGANRASTLSTLNNQNYSQAMSAAQNERAREAAASGLIGGFGNSQINAGQAYGTLGNNQVNAGQALIGAGTAQSNAGSTMAQQGATMGQMGTNFMNGARDAYSALLNGGNTQQASEQRGLDANYGQFMQEQGFPYQQTQWLAGLTGNLGGQTGQTTTGTTPGPNPMNQIIGAGATAASLAPYLAPLFAGLKHGGRVAGFSRGGRARAPRHLAIPGFAAGGVIPYSSIEIPMRGGGSWIPSLSISAGGGAGTPTVPRFTDESSQALTSGMNALGNAARSGAFAPAATPGAYGGGINGSDFSIGYGGQMIPAFAANRGGRIPGFAAGGMVDYEEIDLSNDPAFTLNADRLGLDKPVEWTNPAMEADVPPLGERATSYQQPSPPQGGFQPSQLPSPTLPAAFSRMDPPQEPLPAGVLAYGPGTLPPTREQAMQLPAQGMVQAGFAPQPQGKFEEWANSPWAALAQAGLRMMASRSPTIGGALGEAGQAGFGALGKQADARQKMNTPKVISDGPTLKFLYPDGRLLDTAIPTMTAAQKAQRDDTRADRQSTERYRNDSLGLQRDQLKAQLEGSKIPPGFERDPNGGIRPVAGGPQDPEYLRRRKESEREGSPKSVESRRIDAERAGLKPEDPAYRSFLLTGKMPREDQQPLSATDKKAILEADEQVLATQAAIDSLGRAKELSKEAYEGPTAGARGYATSLFGNKSGEATETLTNEVMANSLSQLKSIFGGAPTEGERKILLDIQGSVSKPHAVREKIYQRAQEAAEKRLAFNRERAAELRGQTYYKPDAARKSAASAGETKPGVSSSGQPREGERKQFKQGWGVWNGKAWVPEQ